MFFGVVSFGYLLTITSPTFIQKTPLFNRHLPSLLNRGSTVQRVKKVLSDSLGLVDFAIELVNAVPNLPKGQMKFFEKFKSQKSCNQCC